MPSATEDREYETLYLLIITMPNRCSNTVEISWSTDEVLYVKKAIKKRSFFNNIRRLPAKKKEERYNRHMENRGTKRDVGKNDFSMLDYTASNHMANLSIWFDTARWPPVELLEHLAKKRPKLYIDLIYSEPGNCFSGTVTREWWEEIASTNYDDAYYGEGQECPDCHCTYDPEDECMWDEELPHLCIDCAEEHRKLLLTEQSKWESSTWQATM